MFQNCQNYYLLLKKLYPGVLQGKSCKLRCGLAKWPNIHKKNLKNGQLEFLQPILEKCLLNGFHCNHKLGQIYYILGQLLLLQIKLELIITNRGKFITNWGISVTIRGSFYKLRQLLQISAQRSLLVVGEIAVTLAVVVVSVAVVVCSW